MMKLDRLKIINYLFTRSNENNRRYNYDGSFEDLYLVTCLNREEFSSKEEVNFDLLKFTYSDIILKSGVRQVVKEFCDEAI
jgi:hypothetical protein